MKAPASSAPADGARTRRSPADIRVLLFDVGGVLVQLSGIETMLEWLGNHVTVDDMWVRWLRSPSVRGFETGKIGAEEFAAGVIREFGLSVTPQAFLESFAQWPTGLFPGTLEMLERIPGRYRRATLSNSNALHWPRVQSDMLVGAVFDSHFISHLTGRIKPDLEAFEHVAQSLGCPAAQVLFLDDNLLNVEAARQAGMHAAQVRGPAEVERALCEFGIMERGD